MSLRTSSNVLDHGTQSPSTASPVQPVCLLPVSKCIIHWHKDHSTDYCGLIEGQAHRLAGDDEVTDYTTCSTSPGIPAIKKRAVGHDVKLSGQIVTIRVKSHGSGLISIPCLIDTLIACDSWTLQATCQSLVMGCHKPQELQG